MAFYLTMNEYSIQDANTRERINRTLRVLRSCLSIKIFRGTVLLSSCLARLSSQDRYEDSTPFMLLSYTFRRPASAAPRHHFDLPIETPPTSFPASSSPAVGTAPSSSTSCTCGIRFLLRPHPSPAIFSSFRLSYVHPVSFSLLASRHFDITHQRFTISVTY